MLTDTQVRNAKPEAKPYKLSANGGLYVEITPVGGKHWRYRFRIDGKENVFALGSYPEVRLADARRGRDAAAQLVKQGINPTLAKKQELVAKQFERATTFEAVAKEWFDAKQAAWSAGHRKHIDTILRSDINPRIGAFPIKEVRTPHVYDVLKKIEARGALTRASLARQIMGGVMTLAILTHRAEFDVVAPLKRQVARRQVAHRLHLREDDLPDFLRALEDYTGQVTTRIALKLLFLTAVRPGELCGAPWSEFDLERAEWCIPAARMKMGTTHIVPLSTQAVALLKQLHEVTGHTNWLFPSQGRGTTMPTATLRNAVTLLGYAGRFNPHGARGTFSTICNEAGYRPDVIELQLSHMERNRIRSAYNHASYLPERRKMMQAYADRLDLLVKKTASLRLVG